MRKAKKRARWDGSEPPPERLYSMTLAQAQEYRDFVFGDPESIYIADTIAVGARLAALGREIARRDLVAYGAVYGAPQVPSDLSEWTRPKLEKRERELREAYGHLLQETA